MRKPNLNECRKKIERSYQRAMNIRDSIQSDLTDKEEAAYSAAYRYAYRIGEVAGFRMATRKYLHDLRSYSRAVLALKSVGLIIDPLKAGTHD